MKISSFAKSGMPFMLVLAICVAFLAACTKDDKGDVSTLLATVPSNSGSVCVIDIKSLCESTGAKVKDNKIENCELLESMLGMSAESSKAAGYLKDGKSGMEITYAVVFSKGYNTYLTGLLSNPDDFKAMLKECAGSEFSSESDVDLAGSVAVKGNQYWISFAGDVSASDVKEFSSLSERQSFLSDDYADALLKSDKMAVFVADIQSMINVSDLGVKNSATLRMAMASVFKDAAYLAGDLDIEKGNVKIAVSVLNSKHSVAEFLLPIGKIDVATIKSLGGTADDVVAFACPNALVTKIITTATNLGLPSNMFDGLKSIDGTIAIVSSAPAESLSMIVQTNGKGESSLIDFINSYKPGLNVVKEGNNVLVKGGERAGKVEVATAAADMKGAFLGIVSANMNNSNLTLPKSNVSYSLQRISLMLKPDGKGVKLEGELKLSKTAK
jgi:hypothetical protein